MSLKNAKNAKLVPLAFLAFLASLSFVFLSVASAAPRRTPSDSIMREARGP